MYLHKIASRLVMGYDRVQAIAAELLKQGVWLTIEPQPGESYRLVVKDEDSDKLPPVRDFSKAEDAELVQLANSLLPRTINSELGHIDPVEISPRILGRDAAGFWIATRSYVPFPLDRA